MRLISLKVVNLLMKPFLSSVYVGLRMPEYSTAKEGKVFIEASCGVLTYTNSCSCTHA